MRENRRSRTARVYLALALPLLALSTLPSRFEAQVVPERRPSGPQPVAFVNVHVIPMDTERILLNQTVVVLNGRIASIEPTGKNRLPPVKLVIDGGGKQYLLPGLADMHVHIFDPNEMLLYLANGVTTIRNLHGTATHLRWRESLNKGEMLGPRLFTAGPIVDGDPPARATNKVIRTVDEARQVVAEQKQAGYDFLKIYDNVPRDLYRVLAEEAAKHSLPLVGHLPTPVGLTGLFEIKGQKCVEHVEELLPFFNDGRVTMGVREMAEGLAAAGVWIDPTMVVHENAGQQHTNWPGLLSRPEMKYMNPATMRDWGWIQTGESRARVPAGAERYRRTMAFFQNTLVPELQRAGVRLLVGTDAPIPAIIPGFSLLNELRAFVQSGLTPYQTLEAATRNAASFVGQTEEFGMVSVGQSADLILLAANPLEDINHLERRVGVMVRGRWLAEEELRRRLDELAASYNTQRERSQGNDKNRNDKSK
jgi:imidazolonepropionase-like amidohydrolase